ncbi:MAG TPA: hypothetical protein EYN38_02840 [Flavobacteriales bacterium]|nr:hypothetical protein [Flavobacteriales bacterium]HIO72023.1 hypothetical protein [Flavobacteriales bacterium]
MIVYTFIFKDGKQFRFEVDEEGDTSVESPDQPVEEWLKLENGKCDGCGIPEGERKTCPAALSIQPILASFGGRFSHETVKVIVEMNDVEVHGSMSTQNAVRSLMGLRLALSACPVMKMLRPMARFHVPFGGMEHSLFRFVGMHLISEHLRREKGHSSNQDLSGLRELIHRLHEVNQKLADRIRLGAERDATVNSLVVLDTLASILKMDIDSSLETLKPYFGMYLDEE